MRRCIPFRVRTTVCVSASVTAFNRHVRCSRGQRGRLIRLGRVHAGKLFAKPKRGATNQWRIFNFYKEGRFSSYNSDKKPEFIVQIQCGFVQ